MEEAVVLYYEYSYNTWYSVESLGEWWVGLDESREQLACSPCIGETEGPVPGSGVSITSCSLSCRLSSECKHCREGVSCPLGWATGPSSGSR